MEKHKFFTNEGNGIPQAWNPIFGIGIQGSELNASSNGVFNPNWNNQMDQRDLFESALSSIVSSPANSHAGIPVSGAGESIVLRELIGRLGSICNSGEAPSLINGNRSSNTSCYNTPLNSPPKLNLSIPGSLPLPLPLPIPGNHQFPCFPHKMESENQSFRTVGSHLIGIHEQKDPKNTEVGDSIEESSISEQIPTGMKSQSTSRKRKGTITKGKGKETPSSTTISAKDDKAVAEPETEESKAKRSKSNEEEENAKPPEPPKDYIHVRARRGQATDSHSLAERVRREKISERMKFLQDLVPGCNKVTGKAVMLDEIINYVQSLQRQVEFLSMKLATVNPRMDVSMEALLSKDMFRSRVSLPTSMNPYDTSPQAFPYGFQSQSNGMVRDGASSENQFSVNPLMAAINRKPSHPGVFGEASTLWENDLQSVVEMGLGQNQPQSCHGQMKVEL